MLSEELGVYFDVTSSGRIQGQANGESSRCCVRSRKSANGSSEEVVVINKSPQNWSLEE